MNKLFQIILLSLSIVFVEAQNYESDAIRLSSENFTGSARFTALSGAFAGVGSDLSNLSHNPGGVGMFKSSFIQGSLGYSYTSNNANFYNNNTKEFRGNVVLPNLGVVFASKKGSRNGRIRNATFALGVNQLANYSFNERIQHYNTTPNASITNIWNTEMNEVYGTTNADVQEGLPSLSDVSFETFNAYYGYLVNYDSSVLGYTTPVQGEFLQRRLTEVTGTKNEFYLSSGANFEDKLYFGATLGIPIVNYRNNMSYSEEDTANSAQNLFFNRFTSRSNYRMEGLGVNFKLGLIYKPSQWFRLGAAFHTPERISLTENYSAQLESFNDVQNTNFDALEGEAEYRLRLPWKSTLGMSFFLKKSGFISIDYQAVGHGTLRYDFGNEFNDFSDQLNNQIKGKYQLNHQIRVGAEVVIKKVRLRGGYSYTSSPVKKEFRENVADFSRQSFSGGIGFIIGEKIALDLAYIHYVVQDFEQPYRLTGVEISGIERQLSRGNAVVSFAYRFR